MGSSLLPRRLSIVDEECAPGYHFYTCSLNNFAGCCSIDPCGLPIACPSENRPAFSTSSSNAPVITSQPTPRPFSTNAASFTNLSTSRTVTIVIPTTHLPSPTTTTATISAIISVSPSSSPSSSSSASSSSKQINPVGLIVGLTIGFTVLALMLALVIFLLWRRRQTRDGGDEEPILPIRSLRTTAFYLPQKQQSTSLIMTSPNMEKPVPPAPTSSRPWRESFAEAGLSDQAGDESTARTSNSAAPAPTVWRHARGPAALSRARTNSAESGREAKRETAATRGRGAQQPNRRSASPVDSIFDVPQRRTTAEMDASWAIFREGPAAFHGLSAPPRSRDGSRPGSNSNQGG